MEPPTQPKAHRFFYLEGLFFILLGIASFLWPKFSTIAFEIIIAWIFILSAIIQTARLISNAVARSFTSILICACYYIVGAILLFYPLSGVITLTLVLAFLLLFQGIAQIIFGIQNHITFYGKWTIINGIVAALLGILIWLGWPSDSAWILGMFVGINLFFLGFTQIVFAHQLKKHY